MYRNRIVETNIFLGVSWGYMCLLFLYILQFSSKAPEKN
jgi:hypothetical protein